MSFAAWAEFGGIELANAARTFSYVRASAAMPRLTVGSATSTCVCEAVDDGPYASPAADPAPWWYSSQLQSDDFLGLWLREIELGSVLARAVTPRATGGASIGRQRPRHRIIGFSGLMFAATDGGMKYGERWLTDLLAGNLRGCAPDTLRILPYCPHPDEVTDTYRTLTRVGIADGPLFGAWADAPRCNVQSFSFQLVAGNPYLRSEANPCLTDEPVSAAS